MDRKILDAVRAGRFQRTDDGGIYIPQERILARGRFVVSKRGEPDEYYNNLVTNEGLDYILKAALGETAGISNWYLAPFSGDVTVLATWTAAGFTAAATEWTDYDESARQLCAFDNVASQGADSFSSKSSFTSSSDSQTVRGVALISASAKSATSGTLLAASRLSSDKGLDTGEILDIGYGLQLTAV
jgi:hypothetical protein